MSEQISVLVDVKDGRVLIQELVETTDGLALNPRSAFSELGTIREAQIPGAREGVLVHGWTWESEGYSGEAKSKAGAVAAMLNDAGYVQVRLTATIPDLLEGLGVDA